MGIFDKIRISELERIVSEKDKRIKSLEETISTLESEVKFWIQMKETRFTNVERHEPIARKETDLASVVNKNNPFFGKKIVITGVFNSFSREGLSDILISYGAFRINRISSKTDMLIMGMDPGPSKLDKVVEMQNEGANISIINESSLLKMLDSIEKNS